MALDPNSLIPKGDPADISKLMDALRMVESGGRRNAVSEAGAMGPYQLMPATAKGAGVADPTDEDTSREAATGIMRRNLAKYGGNQRLALMAYHAGEGNVDKYLRGEPSKVGPRTRAYPDKVFAQMGIAGEPPVRVASAAPQTVNDASPSGLGGFEAMNMRGNTQLAQASPGKIDWGKIEGAAAPSPSKIDWSQIEGDAGAQVEPSDESMDMADVSLGTIARSSIATSSEKQMRAYAEQMFPDMPIDQAIKRFGYKDGQFTVTGPDGKVRAITAPVDNVIGEAPAKGKAYWEPSSSRKTGNVPVFQGPQNSISENLRRAGRWAASQAGPGAEAAGGIGGGILGTLVGPWTSLFGAGLGAGAVHTGRDVLDAALSPNTRVKDLDPVDTGIHSGLAAGEAMVGQALGLGMGALWAKARAGKNPFAIEEWDRALATDPANLAKWKEVVEEGKRRGIDLSLGQATGLSSVQNMERQLGRFPQTTNTMDKFFTNQQEEQVPKAIMDEVKLLSPSNEGRAAKIANIRNASDDIIAQQREANLAASKGHYDTAFRANQNIVDKDIQELLERDSGIKALKLGARKMRDMGIPPGSAADPELMAALKEANEIGIMSDEEIKAWFGAKGMGYKLRTLDYAKRALGDMEDEAFRAGKYDDSRIFKRMRQDLTTHLDRVDKTGEYAVARGAYAEGAELVDSILQGGVGKLHDLTGVERSAVVDRVFSKQNMNALEMSRMRQIFKKAGHEQDWNDGLSVWLNDKLANAMGEGAQGGEMGNVAGKFRKAVWGHPQQRELVKAAIGNPDRVLGMERLMEVLKAASDYKPVQPSTATDVGATVLKPGMFRRMFGYTHHPVLGALDATESIIAGRQALKEPQARIDLARALTSGDYDKDLRALRMVSHSPAKSQALVGQILTRAGITGGAAALGIDEQQDREPQDQSPLSGAR